MEADLGAETVEAGVDLGEDAADSEVDAVDFRGVEVEGSEEEIGVEGSGETIVAEKEAVVRISQPQD